MGKKSPTQLSAGGLRNINGRAKWPAMRALPGTGPRGKTCRECGHWDAARCAEWARYWKVPLGMAPTTVAGHNEACKHFEQKAAKT